MRVTPEYIRERRQELEDEGRQIEAAQELLKGKYKALAAICPHKNVYRYSCMGEPGRRCRDCGSER